MVFACILRILIADSVLTVLGANVIINDILFIPILPIIVKVHLYFSMW